MGLYILLKNNMKKQKSSIVGVALIIFITSFVLVMASTIFSNSRSYISNEMERLGYGDITEWVSGAENLNTFSSQLFTIDDIDNVELQPLIFSGYSINGIHSDNDGQLISYNSSSYDYKILNNSLNGYKSINSIPVNEIYISPALHSKYDFQIGDTVRFAISRNNDYKEFIIGGYFEDPFMGSSMIDMKSFLINEVNYNEIAEMINDIAEGNVLAQLGGMIHIFQKENSDYSVLELNSLINNNTNISQYSEFVYTKSTIYGFMIVLQNIFTGFLSAFVLILIIVSMIIMGHSISNTVEQESKNIGILKTIGYSGIKIKLIQIVQYVIAIIGGMILAVGSYILLAKYIPQFIVTSTGILVPARIPYRLCLLGLVIIASILIIYINFKTSKILKIIPVEIISGNISRNFTGRKKLNEIKEYSLLVSMAIRQIITSKRRYISLGLVSIILVFFLCIVGRIDTWLGDNGEGLMNAFSAAEHDLGVQPMDDIDMTDIEVIINDYSEIKESYQLAMENVVVNGVDYTANIINEPFRFDIISGNTCLEDNDIVITEYVANDLDIKIGDSVTITYAEIDYIFKVSGIYQCANEMGANIGMNIEGFKKIADIHSNIWCYHYILADRGVNDIVMEAILSKFPIEVDVHTNSWSGLDGIVNTMNLLIIFMYIVVIIIVFIVVSLTSSKMLYSEQRDMAICKNIGFTTNSLRYTFTIKFAIVVAIGASIGSLLSNIFANFIITSLINMFGIGQFNSSFEFRNGILPALIVIILFSIFAYILSARIKKVEIVNLVNK